MDHLDYPKYPSESAEVAAQAHGQRVAKAKQLWDELKNELAALMMQHTAKGTWGRGFNQACLEDADTSVLMLLDDVQREIVKSYAIEE